MASNRQGIPWFARVRRGQLQDPQGLRSVPRPGAAHPLVAALVLVHHAGLLLLARLPVLALRSRRRLGLALPLRLLEAVGAEPPRTAAVALRRPRVDQMEGVLLRRRWDRITSMRPHILGSKRTPIISQARTGASLSRLRAAA